MHLLRLSCWCERPYWDMLTSMHHRMDEQGRKFQK